MNRDHLRFLFQPMKRMNELSWPQSRMRSAQNLSNNCEGGVRTDHYCIIVLVNK